MESRQSKEDAGEEGKAKWLHGDRSRQGSAGGEEGWEQWGAQGSAGGEEAGRVLLWRPLCL